MIYYGLQIGFAALVQLFGQPCNRPEQIAQHQIDQDEQHWQQGDYRRQSALGTVPGQFVAQVSALADRQIVAVRAFPDQHPPIVFMAAERDEARA